MANRVYKRNNVLKALADTNWGLKNDILLMTYNALGSSIANCAAPVWSTNDSEINMGKIQPAQNEALRVIIGSHKKSSIGHLHSETEMLLVEDYMKLLFEQYLVHYLDTENGCHQITKMDHPTREMNETIFIRPNRTDLLLLANTSKDTLHEIHTSFVNTAIDNKTDNRLLSIDLHLSITRNPIYGEDNGQLYHSSVLDIPNF